MSHEDNTLIHNYLEGDEDSLARLVKRHIDMVYAFLLRLTGDKDAAEDATQQTFINVWKHLSSYDTKRNFTTWILAIARNAAIDILRKKKSVPMSYFETDEGGNAIIDTTADPEPLPDELFARSAIGEDLARALNQLSFSEREVLLLHYEQGLTFEEIGVALHTSRNTVKSRERRAIIKLRKFLIRQDN